MYPVQDRSKPPGIIPGMLKGHPALYPDGRMKEDATAELQEALIAEYKTEDFQKKLYAGWHATDDLMERHKWRQEVSMEVQRHILPQYGFEGSRRGVFASGISCNCSVYSRRAEEIMNSGRLMEWLVNPDRQEASVDPDFCSMTNWIYVPPPKEGEQPASGYEISLTSEDDADAVFHIAQMQGVLAGAHQAMYKDVFPDANALQWFGVLGINRSCSEAVESGSIIYHARTKDTGVIAGYISCSCNYGGGGGGGARSSAREAGDEEALEDDKPHGVVNHIIVLDQHRGHGVGKMLFHELLEHLAEACPSISNDLRISVAERNWRAKEWYERLGFSPVSTWQADLGAPGHSVTFLKLQRTLDGGDFDDIFG